MELMPSFDISSKFSNITTLGGGMRVLSWGNDVDSLA